MEGNSHYTVLIPICTLSIEISLNEILQTMYQLSVKRGIVNNIINIKVYT